MLTLAPLAWGAALPVFRPAQETRTLGIGFRIDSSIACGAPCAMMVFLFDVEEYAAVAIREKMLGSRGVTTKIVVFTARAQPRIHWSSS